ncbi:MAG: YceI family protein [Chitinophagales bacterium]|nr:YceI family protein [Chitinophagales bacterium]
MKKIITSVALVASMAMANAQTWQLDKSHSSVKFSVTHMMVSETEGNFKSFTANVTAQKEDFSDLSADFTIQVKSINTDDEKRDGHLASPDFFDAEKYPTITFKSTSFKKVGEKSYKLAGEITMHGVTKPVTFDVKYNGTAKDPYGNTKAGFRASTIVKRSDFNISWNKVLDTGGFALSDEVQVFVNIELNKK